MGSRGGAGHGALPCAALTAFTELPIHPSLAAAIGARGYETATPVQTAVLDPSLAGRDLLVSSPTGSGKTLAFGTLLADKLLAPSDAPLTTGVPRALVVAPTRELAAQVCRELGWLFAQTKTRAAPFTGGTPIGPDMKRLRTGVDIVVGTPGRLVDLHKRKVLDLSAIEVLVLDEGDEMLDLGFKDDLEYLLGHTPAERRTLLFSATLPPEIQRLAATYQRQAMRVDPRGGGGGEAHADITYVGHLVRTHDRLAAVINVLLAAGEAKTIVFCRTREGVGALHQRLVAHGFRAAAIAGDRAQGDRDRALDALRLGQVRVLVATNVAARGLDLPDVDLVLHADLPENAESLTHRSGRTGRAGKKGTSVVIAAIAERRKAERMLSGAGASGQWTPAPTEADVRRMAHERLVATLVAELGSAGAPPDESDELAALADRLRAALPERALLPLLLRREAARLPPPLPLEPVDPHRRERLNLETKTRKQPSARTGHKPPLPAAKGPAWDRAVVFRINLGAEAKAEPGWLLPLICRRGGVTRREVGAIRVGRTSSTFEIAAEASDDFALSAREIDPRAPHVRIEPVHTGPKGRERQRRN